MKQSNTLKEIDRQIAFLSFGSNIGNSREIINNAIKYLNDIELLDICKVSSFYLTEPWGIRNQNWFYNLVAMVETHLSAFELITFSKTIEIYLGRQVRPKWEERELDIDLLFYGNLILQSSKITIPHPQIENRRFVLEPMDEIAPDFIHPVRDISIHQILLNCKDKSKVIRENEF